MVSDGKSSTGMLPLTLNFEPMNDLGNWISSLPDCTKYLCKFWFKSLQCYKSYPVRKISLAVAAWLWSLNENNIGVMRNCDEFRQISPFIPVSHVTMMSFIKYVHSFWKYKGLKRTHRCPARHNLGQSICRQWH